MHSAFQDESSSEKTYTLPYSYQDFEKLEERYRSLLLMTVLEMKEDLEGTKRNYREALMRYMSKKEGKGKRHRRHHDKDRKEDRGRE